MADKNEVRMQVQRYLEKNLDVLEVRGENFFVNFGSSGCQISCTEWGETSVIVKLLAYVLGEVPITDDLWIALGKMSGEHVFGVLHAVPDQGGDTCTLYFGYNLVGDTLDEGELMWSLSALVKTADDLDDELQERFDGRRLAD